MKYLFFILICQILTCCLTIPKTPKQIKNGIYNSSVGDFTYQGEDFMFCESIQENFDREGGNVQFFYPMYFERIDFMSFKPLLQDTSETIIKTILNNYINREYIPGIQGYIKNGKVVTQKFQVINGKLTLYFSMNLPDSSYVVDGNRKQFSTCRSMMAYVTIKGIYVFTISSSFKEKQDDQSVFDENEKSNQIKLNKFFTNTTIKL